MNKTDLLADLLKNNEYNSIDARMLSADLDMPVFVISKIICHDVSDERTHTMNPNMPGCATYLPLNRDCVICRVPQSEFNYFEVYYDGTTESLKNDYSVNVYQDDEDMLHMTISADGDPLAFDVHDNPKSEEPKEETRGASKLIIPQGANIVIWFSYNDQHLFEE